MPEQASCPERWAAKKGNKKAFFEHNWCAHSPCPHQKWAGLTICSKCSWIMCQVWSSSLLWFQRHEHLKQNSGKCMICHAPLFSNLVIYDNYVCMLSCFDQECNNSKLFNAHHALASLPCKHEGGIIQHMEERDQLGQKSLKKCNANRRHKEPLES